VTNAIHRIQEIQQKRIAAEERTRRAINEKHSREVQAFVSSPVYQLFALMRHLPLQTRYASVIGPMLVHAVKGRKDDVLAGKTNLLTMARGGPAAHTIMWRCEEVCADRMRYIVSGSYGHEDKAYNEAGVQLFEDSFVEFVAELLDPTAVAEIAGANISKTDTPRRLIKALT
jgi:hypothetical protein